MQCMPCWPQWAARWGRPQVRGQALAAPRRAAQDGCRRHAPPQRTPLLAALVSCRGPPGCPCAAAGSAVARIALTGGLSCSWVPGCPHSNSVYYIELSLHEEHLQPAAWAPLQQGRKQRACLCGNLIPLLCLWCMSMHQSCQAMGGNVPASCHDTPRCTCNVPEWP